MFYLLIALALTLIIGTAFYAGRKSGSAAAVNINRIFLEELSPEEMTDGQREVHESYRTLQNLKETAADPTWEAFMLHLHGKLWLPLTITPDHLTGGQDIDVVIDLVAQSFPRRNAALAVA